MYSNGKTNDIAFDGPLRQLEGRYLYIKSEEEFEIFLKFILKYQINHSNWGEEGYQSASLHLRRNSTIKLDRKLFIYADEKKGNAMSCSELYKYIKSKIYPDE